MSRLAYSPLPLGLGVVLEKDDELLGTILNAPEGAEAFNAKGESIGTYTSRKTAIYFLWEMSEGRDPFYRGAFERGCNRKLLQHSARARQRLA